MKKVTIYHNNRCSKSRQALALLEGSAADIKVVQYMNEPMSKETLLFLLKKLGYTAEQLLRKNEQVFKELIKGKNLTEDAILELMCANPKLIERPIVISNDKALVARPPELVKEFFTSA
tara:strand:+ start:540 stop:896 length:357 start_codon:yes stop_codon:yes gene_type:complete